MTAYVIVVPATRTGQEAVALPASADFRKTLARHGAVALPSPAAAQASGKPGNLTIQAPDMEQADRLAAVLRDMEGIETAYAKPGEELP